MPPEIVPLLQLVGLVAVGLLLRSRVMVLLVAAAMAGLAVVLSGPVDLGARSPQQLAMDFGGIAVGALAALWVAAVRGRRVDANRWARSIEDAAPRSRGAEPQARRTSVGTVLLATLIVGGVAGGALYVEGTQVPAVRTTVDGWLSSPTFRALGLPITPMGKADPAPARPGDPATGAAALQASDKPRARAASATERPRGDMRHCLERGAPSDVLRCAEQGR
jgi:hypothetical protein